MGVDMGGGAFALAMLPLRDAVERTLQKVPCGPHLLLWNYVCGGGIEFGKRQKNELGPTKNVDLGARARQPPAKCAELVHVAAGRRRMCS